MKLEIDKELVTSVLEIWDTFHTELVGDEVLAALEDKGATAAYVAGHLTIAYMCKAQEGCKPSSGYICSSCSDRPFVLFGKPPDKCRKCGGEIIIDAVVKEAEQDGDIESNPV